MAPQSLTRESYDSPDPLVSFPSRIHQHELTTKGHSSHTLPRHITGRTIVLKEEKQNFNLFVIVLLRDVSSNSKN